MTAPRPGPPTIARCPLPAVGTWTAYPVRPPAGNTVDEPAYAFCRLHSGMARAAAEHHAATESAAHKYKLHETATPPGSVAIRCSANASGPAAVAACDAERIRERSHRATSGAHALMALTSCAPGGDTPLGNEPEVLAALLEVAEYVDAQTAVVARRLAARVSWQAVHDAAPDFSTDARDAQQQWDHPTPTAVVA